MILSSLSLVDFSVIARGIVFHASLLNGDVALCLIAIKIYGFIA
jgi:hypothetical protein